MKCPASEDGKCQLVVAMGASCNGYSQQCKMRSAVEQQARLVEGLIATVRSAFGIKGD